jgi:hypothetical protein
MRGVERVRFVRLLVRRTAALGAVTVIIVAVLALGGGQALADTPGIPGAPLAGSAGATLSQVNAGEWTTTVYLDTAALCAGKNPAGNKFALVTGKPNSVTGAAAPQYPDGPLPCGSAAAAAAVTEVKLTFTPSPALSAVPQTAALVVTPPPARLTAGDPPLQVPLTVRRTVSPWQYVVIPAICGGALAVLLVLVLMMLGMPGEGDAPSPERAQPDFSQRLLLFLMAKQHELLVTEMPAGDDAKGGARPRAGTGRQPERLRWGLAFWRTPLFAGAAWSFGDSWATSVTPLTALAGGVLAASGAVAGLVPGVDLTRFGLLMALVGGLTTLAPLLFAALNSLFPAKAAAQQAPAGEVTAAQLWVMLLPSCLTVFAIGAEIGFVGIVLAFDLIVASPSVRWLGPVVTGLAGLLFLAYGAHSILTLAGQPMGTPKNTARKSSFMI